MQEIDVEYARREGEEGYVDRPRRALAAVQGSLRPVCSLGQRGGHFSLFGAVALGERPGS